MTLRSLFVMAAAGSIALASLGLGACSSSKTNDRPSDITGDGSSGSSPDGVDPACVGTNGCYACEPKQLVEFLNQCSGSQCAPFDNSTRLPLYDGGALPPLP